MSSNDTEPKQDNTGHKTDPAELTSRSGMNERMFIVFTGASTSIVAFSIDMMLPAIMDIGQEYHIQSQNDPQLVIVVFLFAFGLSQLIFGPLTDSFGRKAILVGALIAFALSSLAAIFSSTFELLLIARFVSGLSAGAARSASQAIIRDCFVGRDMARVMSHIFTVFMIAPIIAPPIGQAIIYVSNWHWIFLFLGFGGAILAAWAALSLKETHPHDKRMAFTFQMVFEAFKETLIYRRSTGYAIVNMMVVSALFTFLASSPQIFGELYGLGDGFLLVFMTSAAFLALSSMLNAHLVKTVDMRRIMHNGLLVFFIVTLIFLAFALSGHVPFILITMIVICATSLFGFTNANSAAVALEPLGHVAGTASSLIATFGATGGAVFGGMIARAYDGTVLPMAIGYVILASISLLAAFWGERGKLSFF